MDQLVIQAADGNRRFVPGVETARFVGSLARRPGTVARRLGGLGTELAKVATGRSERTPPRGDRRFADPAWKENWLFRRLVQGYLAVGDTVEQLVDDADLEWGDEQRVRFLAEFIVDAAAPTNNPLTNPAALKATIDKGGRNFVDRRPPARARCALPGQDPGQRRPRAVRGGREPGRDARRRRRAARRSTSCCSSRRRPRRSATSRSSSCRR